jgi:hypothetical protein
MKLWAATSPTLLGVVVACGVVGCALLFLVRLLRDSAEDEPARPRDALDDELEAIRSARARLHEELECTRGALRLVLLPTIEEPLQDLHVRVEKLVAAARSVGPPPAELARIENERERVDRELQLESDDGARAVLAAQRRDLDANLELQRALARSARLATLELGRLRTLLESLPARVRDLGTRQLLENAQRAPVEAIAHSLEDAVKNTSLVLEGIKVP